MNMTGLNKKHQKTLEKLDKQPFKASFKSLNQKNYKRLICSPSKEKARKRSAMPCTKIFQQKAIRYLKSKARKIQFEKDNQTNLELLSFCSLYSSHNPQEPTDSCKVGRQFMYQGPSVNIYKDLSEENFYLFPERKYNLVFVILLEYHASSSVVRSPRRVTLNNFLKNPETACDHQHVSRITVLADAGHWFYASPILLDSTVLTMHYPRLCGIWFVPEVHSEHLLAFTRSQFYDSLGMRAMINLVEISGLTVRLNPGDCLELAVFMQSSSFIKELKIVGVFEEEEEDVAKQMLLKKIQPRLQQRLNPTSNFHKMDCLWMMGVERLTIDVDGNDGYDTTMLSSITRRFPNLKELNVTLAICGFKKLGYTEGFVRAEALQNLKELPLTITRCAVSLCGANENEEQEDEGMRKSNWKRAKKNKRGENHSHLLDALKGSLNKPQSVVSQAVTELIIPKDSGCNEILAYFAINGCGGLEMFEFPRLSLLTVSLGALGACVTSLRKSGTKTLCWPNVSTLTLFIDQASDVLFCEGLEVLDLKGFPSLENLKVEFGADPLNLGSREKRLMRRMVNKFVELNGYMNFNEVTTFLSRFNVYPAYISGLFGMACGSDALECYTDIINHPYATLRELHACEANDKSINEEPISSTLMAICFYEAMFERILDLNTVTHLTLCCRFGYWMSSLWLHQVVFERPEKMQHITFEYEPKNGDWGNSHGILIPYTSQIKWNEKFMRAEYNN
ncbi:uncharacterized protein SAPINGB_P000480 [Magnusiomyces paraingens]|uniref:Uncharacterized protein n=1 Tax=Magnusiomyces paraingens TaxID=2606893 RepID=A0A5E8B1G6_9ASCO|nr:uncharacterized protein SAPINGB_P000480 [Saprochaete ingens]VVT44630.1 unnamed protein product [Saprochaete ingens]